MDRQPHLLEVVLALGAVGCLAHLLDSWQQQADEDGDDSDHHQQLDEGEGQPRPARTRMMSHNVKFSHGPRKPGHTTPVAWSYATAWRDGRSTPSARPESSRTFLL